MCSICWKAHKAIKRHSRNKVQLRAAQKENRLQIKMQLSGKEVKISLSLANTSFDWISIKQPDCDA